MEMGDVLNQLVVKTAKCVPVGWFSFAAVSP